MALPLLLAAGTALSIAGQLGKGSAERKAADQRATALRAAASRRIEKGKQQAQATVAEGGASQTSELSSMLGRGVSRQASIVNQSLDEISNRAQFAANQAISDANEEAKAMQEDASAVSEQGRQAQKMAIVGSAGSLLGGYTDYLEGKYGKDAYKNFAGGKWS